MKNLIIAIALVVTGCARGKSRVAVVKPLPKMCGEYDVDYGVPKALVDSNKALSEETNFMINRKHVYNIDIQYVGKKVALFTWVQRVGSVINYNYKSAVEFYDKNGKINHKAIEQECERLKHN